MIQGYAYHAPISGALVITPDNPLYAQVMKMQQQQKKPELVVEEEIISLPPESAVSPSAPVAPVSLSAADFTLREGYSGYSHPQTPMVTTIHPLSSPKPVYQQPEYISAYPQPVYTYGGVTTVATTQWTVDSSPAPQKMTDDTPTDCCGYVAKKIDDCCASLKVGAENCAQCCCFCCDWCSQPSGVTVVSGPDMFGDRVIRQESNCEVCVKCCIVAGECIKCLVECIVACADRDRR